jgi:hypothetical protein
MQERYGYKGWYERMMKAFQYGDNVNELEEKTYYNVIDESKQIIKFAYCEEKSIGILLKVAKEDSNGEPIPLSVAPDGDEYEDALAYINRVKPAGISVEIRSQNADELEVNISVKYNPLLFINETQVQNIVETTIKEYLKSIEYNGSFVGMKMIDFIQTIQGIEIAQINSVVVTHALYREDITTKLSYTPYSGYLKLTGLSVTAE